MALEIRLEIVEEKWDQVLRDPWVKLQNLSNVPNIFQTWEWCTAWWRHFGKNFKPRVLAFKQEDDVVGIAPLYAVRKPWGDLLLWMGTGISDRLGLLTLPDVGTQVEEAFLNYLEQQTSVDLQEIPEGTSWTLRARDRAWYKMSQGVSHYIALPESWEAYAGTSCEKIPIHIDHALEKIRRDFKDVVVRESSVEEMEKTMKVLFELHTRRWRARGLPGEFGASHIRAFHHDWMEIAKRRGWIRFYSLWVNGTVRAVEYLFRYRGRDYGYQNGFDPEFARYRPGVLLFAHAIRQAIQDRCSVFDFLRGEESFKSAWNTQILRHERLCRARGLAAKIWLFSVLRRGSTTQSLESSPGSA